MAAETDAHWVPIAVSADTLDGSVAPARLGTKPIAVWRSASGEVFANGDRCPHRGMRLSHGFVRGETLSCIYHGWRFGTDGACQKIPAHPAVEPPKSINCGPLPVAEENGIIWSASQRPTEDPDAFEGYHALRSLVIDAPLGAIVAACSGDADHAPAGRDAIPTQLAGKPALLLTNPYGPNEVFVIVLVDSTLSVTERLAASNAVETLRRAAEAQAAEARGDAA